jgi:hypothetical protein
MCFHQKSGNAHVRRMCFRLKKQWQGNAIVFPSPTTIQLGNVYVFFFLRFLNNDGQAFCHKPSHVEIKDNKRHAAEKNNGACQNHMTN